MTSDAKRTNQPSTQIFNVELAVRFQSNFVIIFVYSDVSSNSNLNQLMFIIGNNGLFIGNRDTKRCKHAWWKFTEN